MEKKTIGSFIAALRRANGMTQHELADKLNISNKSVSRWERDECAPDLSLIPAIAEIFGVSCDELLRGERSSAEHVHESTTRKAEQQLKAVIIRAVSNAKILFAIAVSITIVGFVCMLGFAYGLYLGSLGGAIAISFSVISIALCIVAVTKLSDIRQSELFDNASVGVREMLYYPLSHLSFIAFLADILFILFELPYLLSSGEVINFEEYITYCIIPSLLLIICIYLIFCKGYRAFITKTPYVSKRVSSPFEFWMNTIQLGCVLIASILFFCAPFFESDPDKTSKGSIAFTVFGVVFLLVNIIGFIALFKKVKDRKAEALIVGLRNIFIIPAALITANIHWVSFSYSYPLGDVRHDGFYLSYLLYAVLYCLAVFGVFAIIDKLIIAAKKNKI